VTNKLQTFLEEVGKDFKNGLKKLEPVGKEALVLAEAAGPEIAALDPLFGAVFQTVVATVASVEQKFAAMGQQAGTGVQKLADAVTILQPVAAQALAAAGKAADNATVENYINAVVAFLNAIPARQPAPVSAAG
jgi:hypothetical protein